VRSLAGKGKKDYDPEEIRYPDQKIVQSELVKEMKSSFIEYAMSVIIDRALPDVRDVSSLAPAYPLRHVRGQPDLRPAF
jgi:hypothetical protein